MSYMTKQNAESFLVHRLFSCTGNLLSSPSQPIRAFTTFLQGWQWLEKIMRLVRDNSMLYVIRSVLSILPVFGCFTGNGRAAFCSTQTIFCLTTSTKCSFADVNKDDFPSKQQGCVWGVEQRLWDLFPAPVGNSILEILCPSAEKDTAGSGKRTAAEWCWARTKMSFEHKITISAFFKTEMVKCHPLKGVPSYKTGILAWKLETLSKMLTGWIQLKRRPVLSWVTHSVQRFTVLTNHKKIHNDICEFKAFVSFL